MVLQRKLRPSTARVNVQLDQLANTPPLQSTTPGLHPVSLLSAFGRLNTYNEMVAVGFPSCRLVLVLMAFFGMINCYTLRVNLSIAIVMMVNGTYLKEIEKDAGDNYTTSYEDVCYPPDKNKTQNVTEIVRTRLFCIMHGFSYLGQACRLQWGVVCRSSIWTLNSQF